MLQVLQCLFSFFTLTLTPGQLERHSFTHCVFCVLVKFQLRKNRRLQHDQNSTVIRILLLIIDSNTVIFLQHISALLEHSKHFIQQVKHSGALYLTVTVLNAYIMESTNT